MQARSLTGSRETGRFAPAAVGDRGYKDGGAGKFAPVTRASLVREEPI